MMEVPSRLQILAPPPQPSIRPLYVDAPCIFLTADNANGTTVVLVVPSGASQEVGEVN